MSAPSGDDAVTYTERDATPAEAATRGRVLEVLSAGHPYVFIVAFDSEDDDDAFRVHVDAADVLDGETIRALLTKTAAAIR